MSTFYGPDLAAIHASAFETLAAGAAETLIQTLQAPGARVLDLGCGAGGLSVALAAHGFKPWGIDISPDLVALARARLPASEFVSGSIVRAELPAASAAAAVGEVLNYASADTADDLAGIFQKVHAALEPGGLFLFDLAGPGRVGAGRAFSEGPDWAVGMVAEEAEGQLIRRITTFRRSEDDHWRRSYEEHRLRLWPIPEVLRLLASSGFHAQTCDGYPGVALPPGLHVYRAVRRN